MNRTPIKLTSMFLLIAFISVAMPVALAEQPVAQEVESLREAAGERFAVGVGVGHRTLEDPRDAELVAKHFSILTPENCMKPQGIQPSDGQYRYQNADNLVAFAKQNGLDVVGHCLVWAKDDRTSNWMMLEGDQPVSRQKLLERIGSHIETVVGRYSDVVSMWDVANEALADSDGDYLRDSIYTRTTGIDFLVHAFKVARASDPDALLIYNDYNCFKSKKREKLIRLLRELKELGAPIDAFGMQGHFELGDVPIDELRILFDQLRELELKVVVSELDIDVVKRGRWWADGGKYREELASFDPYRDECPPEVLQQQADEYAALFGLFIEYEDIVARISFWNLHDGHSWLNHFPWQRVNHPLLIDRERQPKPAFFRVIDVLEEE